MKSMSTKRSMGSRTESFNVPGLPRSEAMKGHKSGYAWGSQIKTPAAYVHGGGYNASSMTSSHPMKTGGKTKAGHMPRSGGR